MGWGVLLRRALGVVLLVLIPLGMLVYDEHVKLAHAEAQAAASWGAVRSQYVRRSDAADAIATRIEQLVPAEAAVVAELRAAVEELAGKGWPEEVGAVEPRFGGALRKANAVVLGNPLVIS